MKDIYIYIYRERGGEQRLRQMYQKKERERGKRERGITQQNETTVEKKSEKNKRERERERGRERGREIGS